MQANPPAPTDSSVEIEHTPAVKVYVATYGGWHTPSKVRDAAASLQSKLEADGVSVDKDYLYITTYDSPMRLFFRHNEVSTRSGGCSLGFPVFFRNCSSACDFV